MARLLTSLLSVLFPAYALQYVGTPVSRFSLDDEEDVDDLGGDDFDPGLLEDEDEDVDADWFPGDDENGDADLEGFGDDEDFSY